MCDCFLLTNLVVDMFIEVTGGSVVQNPHANAGNTGDKGSIPAWGRSLVEEMAIHFIMTAWKNRTEEPGGLHSMG